MNIYDPIGADGFQLCQPINDADYDAFDLLRKGRVDRLSWRPIKVKIYNTDNGKRLLYSDAPWLGLEPLIFRQKAASLMEEWLNPYGELLPLDCPDDQVSVFNPTYTLDALDEDASEVTRFRDGRIMTVKKHVFRPELIRDLDIFKISNPEAPVFVSERFVKAWIDAGLKGLDFVKVWSSNEE